jgi:hypothetical protein
LSIFCSLFYLKKYSLLCLKLQLDYNASFILYMFQVDYRAIMWEAVLENKEIKQKKVKRQLKNWNTKRRKRSNKKKETKVLNYVTRLHSWNCHNNNNNNQAFYSQASWGRLEMSWQNAIKGRNRRSRFSKLYNNNNNQAF